MALEPLPISSQDLMQSGITDSISDVLNAFINEDVMINGAPEMHHFEEETMAASESHISVLNVCTEPYPAREGPPAQNRDPGIFNFTAEISKSESKKYLFSEELNKLYVDIECDFAVQFSWDDTSINCESMYVRATVVFTDKEHAEKRVECCMQHRHAPNLPEHVRLNVLHSSRAFGTPGVYYHGRAESPNSWYSVLVEFASDVRPTTHAYKFVCKNSCSTGIKRRPIAIVFTLEDFDGTQYGRHTVGARACSCPQRDQRVEARKAKPAATPAAPTTPAKRLKREHNAAVPVYTLPQLQVVGGHTLVAGLEMMVRMMEQGLEMKKDDPEYVTSCNTCISNVRATIEQYKLVNGITQ